MNRKSYTFILVVLGVVILFYFNPFVWDTERLQKIYKGDGKIQSIGGFGTSSGYVLEFDSFSLSREFKKNYQILEVPQLGKDVFLKLRIFMEIKEFKSLMSKKSQALKSIAEILVVGSDEKRLLSIRAPLEEFKFTEVGGKPSQLVELFYFSGDLARPKKSSIKSESWEDGGITLQVHFKPSEAGFPEDIRAMFIISCGGYK